MKELSRESRSLLAEARRVEHLSTAEKSRIHGKLAQRIGAGLAVGTALTATATAAEAAHTGALATVLAWLPAAAKVVGVVAVTGAVSVGVVKATRIASQPVHAPARVVTSAGATRARVVPAVATTLVVPEPAEVKPSQLEAQQLPVAVPQTARAKRAPMQIESPSEPHAPPAETDAPKPGADSLTRQVAAIREARVAIRGGSARAALAALDRELPEGQAGALAPEAALARVAAYCRLGDPESARRIANTFAAQYPQSPLVARMRESCAGNASEPGATNF